MSWVRGKWPPNPCRVIIIKIPHPLCAGDGAGCRSDSSAIHSDAGKRSRPCGVQMRFLGQHEMRPCPRPLSIQGFKSDAAKQLALGASRTCRVFICTQGTWAGFAICATQGLDAWMPRTGGFGHGRVMPLRAAWRAAPALHLCRTVDTLTRFLEHPPRASRSFQANAASLPSSLLAFWSGLPRSVQSAALTRPSGVVTLSVFELASTILVSRRLRNNQRRGYFRSKFTRFHAQAFSLLRFLCAGASTAFQQDRPRPHDHFSGQKLECRAAKDTGSYRQLRRRGRCAPAGWSCDCECRRPFTVSRAKDAFSEFASSRPEGRRRSRGLRFAGASVSA